MIVVIEYIIQQFCKNFRVGERCCEFECLDPPGEDKRYRERERLRALILAGNSSATHLGRYSTSLNTNSLKCDSLVFP